MSTHVRMTPVVNQCHALHNEISHTPRLKLSQGDYDCLCCKEVIFRNVLFQYLKLLIEPRYSANG